MRVADTEIVLTDDPVAAVRASYDAGVLTVTVPGVFAGTTPQRIEVTHIVSARPTRSLALRPSAASRRRTAPSERRGSDRSAASTGTRP